MMIVAEKDFSFLIKQLLADSRFAKFKSVTGPGRSGAVASAYASYILKIPFVPYGEQIPENIKPVLIIDTVENSGRTLRKASARYTKNSIENETAFVIKEPPRVHFFYEV
jgi:hypoxanthine phosphoribosyltransferase